MIPKATIRTFIRHARELGATEAKLIEASSIVTAPCVRMECRYGLGRKAVYSSITETESMEKFRPNVFRMTGGKPRHQFQINREN
jgi:hypothetical protein